MALLPPMFQIPAPPPNAIAIDLRNPVHAQAWAMFEAEREVKALTEGQPYECLPLCSLIYRDERVALATEIPAPPKRPTPSAFIS